MANKKLDAIEPAVGKKIAGPRRSRVSGIDRVLQVLDHLYLTETPASAYAIAKSVGAPLSTVYTLIDDMVDKDLLSRLDDGTVWLGKRLYHYGLVYANSVDLLGIATGEMNALCRQIGETVQICARDGGNMLVLATADGPGHFRVTSRVGTKVPLNWTASGRLLVGHLPKSERIALFRRSAIASPTLRASTDAIELAAASGRAFADRLSIQEGESDFSVACVASPIRDASGACVATISIVLSVHKVAENRARYCEAVMASAGRIESAAGIQLPTATMASISTVMPPGKELKPTAERA